MSIHLQVVLVVDDDLYKTASGRIAKYQGGSWTGYLCYWLVVIDFYVLFHFLNMFLFRGWKLEHYCVILAC